MRGLIARARSFFRGLGRPDRLDREMDEEMRFHVEMEAERLVRERGVSPREARRRARLAFGSADRYKEEGRDVRGLSGITGLSLDVKLGARMLAKYPWVTVVGGIAMVIGVGAGAAYIEIVNDFLRPTVPLDEGERIVGVQNWDVAENDPELRSLHDFMVWREELESVASLGAFRSVEQNLGIGEGPAQPARGAEMTPSGFHVARVPALLGRTLDEADEQPGAPPVIVLGHDLWRERFAGDPGVVGRTVRLGPSTSTVVGVMPEGFAFPVNHDFWTPLRPEAMEIGAREGPGVQIFGRLAPGASRERAQAELTALGQRAAADSPKTHEMLRPRVVSYPELFIEQVAPGGSGPANLLGIIFVLLLLVLSSNVATLMFARTATRENEVAMRLALGATRGRIIAQFFVEALVLALVATAIGLAMVAWGAGWLTRFFWQVTDGQVPFWLNSRLNLSTVAYAVALAALGSLVAGAIPALKVTGSRLQARLRHQPGGGGSGMRFGGLWGAMIAVQVAFAVLVIPPAIVAVSALAEPGYVDPGFPGEEYLAAHLVLNAENPPTDSAAAARLFSDFERSAREIETLLEATPDVSAVTFATRLPVMNHPQPWMEVDGGGPASEPHWVMPTAVGPDFFETFGARITGGRPLTSPDAASEQRVVVVNQYFVAEMLQGANPIGRRVRYSSRYGERTATGRPTDLPATRMREPGEWYEIVGVVDDLGMDTNRDPFYSGRGPGVYHPLTPAAMGSGGRYAVRLALHLPGGAAAFGPRLREIVHSVDPSLRLYEVLPMDGPVDAANRNERLLSRFASWLTASIGAIALLISVAGTYSVLSFTVARQTREIGIRVALGAAPRRIVAGVFSRAMVQIGVGLLLGGAIWFYFLVYRVGGGGPGLFLATVGVLALVGLAACGVPIRRALRVQPGEVLRDVG